MIVPIPCRSGEAAARRDDHDEPVDGVVAGVTGNQYALATPSTRICPAGMLPDDRIADPLLQGGQKNRLPGVCRVVTDGPVADHEARR